MGEVFAVVQKAVVGLPPVHRVAISQTVNPRQWKAWIVVQKVRVETGVDTKAPRSELFSAEDFHGANTPIRS
ncbi:hypothetical protein ACFX1T_037882 [Malus domestica]